MTGTNPPRILLAGASGRLGGFVRIGWRDRPDFAWLPQSRAPLFENDMKWDPAEGPKPLIREIEKNGPFQAIVVLAGALPGSPASVSNVGIAHSYLDAAAEASVPRVLLASSSAVYGARHGAPFSEQSPCRPSNEYGHDKFAMEKIALDWRDRGVETCSMRIGNVAGADALLLYGRGTETRTIDRFADGRGPVRSWIDGFTLSDAIADLALSPEVLPPAVNVACDPPYAMDELADLAGIPWTSRPAIPSAPHSLAMNNQLLRQFSSSVPQTLSARTLIGRWQRMRDAA